MLTITEDNTADDTEEQLASVFRQISFLTRAYREVMILFYLDGLSTAEIAKRQGTSEGAVRQRLFAARQKIKSEVDEMKKMNNKPVALDDIKYTIWGTGDPGWGDPREGFCRSFSNHVIWLCHKKPMSASEIAEELNVPTVYVEEELEILRKGENGEYGFLRRLDNGKYAINFVLLDKDAFEKANKIYTDQLPKICDIISDFIEEHKAEYLAFPYLNKRVNINLVLWQQITTISYAFYNHVNRILDNKYFAGVNKVDRPFSVYGYVYNGKLYGGGWDGASAENICGFSKVYIDNIYNTRIKRRFYYNHNISVDPQLQLAIRAIEGISITSLSEIEAEHAAKAIECGYLYRDGDVLYTKILVSNVFDSEKLFSISNGLRDGYFNENAEIVAEKIAELIKKSIPDYLWGEWKYANSLANMPILDAVVECLIEKGVLTPPDNGIGAEGCWMIVKK